MSLDLLPSFHPSFTVDSSEGIQDLVSDLAWSVPSEDRYLFNTVRRRLWTIFVQKTQQSDYSGTGVQKEAK